MKKKNYKPAKSTLIKPVNDAEDQVKKFIIILVGVAIVCVLSYLFTAKYLVKDKKTDTKEEETTITYDNIRVGNIFNRPYNSYYVLASDLNENTNYQSLASSYLSKHTDEKIYYIDLSLDINKKYIGNSNKNATKASEIKLKDPTLIKIENGQITNYLDDKSSIENELSK